MEHLFERMNNEIDFSDEYYKIEQLLSEFKFGWNGCSGSINEFLEGLFLYWNKRDTYTSLNQIRSDIGFPPFEQWNYYSQDVNFQGYCLFSELYCNLFGDLYGYYKTNARISEHIDHIKRTIIAVLDRCGFELKRINDKTLVVEKNAVAIEVSGKNLEISSLIIEYNSFLLKGKIERKKELLKHIADVLEPKRSQLNQINKTASDDFFFLVNNMNIRHNNEEPNANANYTPQFAELSNADKEKWYDKVYEQALMLFVLLDSVERAKDIAVFKQSMKK